jgi:predicted O-linked N-acetylglucosamine transferase (SPINDLY family)
MGVPVVSLAGERFIERLSATMLVAVGLDELIARSEADYIAKAVALAQTPARRAALRETLRVRMGASPLCDAPGLAACLENAYRAMWRRHLAV